MSANILIVDDDPLQIRIFREFIARLGFNPAVAGGGIEALRILDDCAGSEKAIDLMLLDLMMEDMDGLTVLEKVRGSDAHMPVIVLTAHGGVETVVNAMRAGATDFIVKPASPERLKVSIDNGLRLRRLAGELSRLSRQITEQIGFTDIIGDSPAMREVTALGRRAAASSIPILIEGESGVGKEVIARAIQRASERRNAPFVVVNCGAIPENLVESILFGHEKGAFTGATERRIGKFREASGGTLFLDEIGELRPDIQVKLLRALQEGEIDPVGASQPVKVDIRLISATNRKLSEMVASGDFREDLYYRLNVFPITIPPLRERREDIPDLAHHFLSVFASAEGKPITGISEEAMTLLLLHDWPGNIRQLENVIFRAVVLCSGKCLDVRDFPGLRRSLAPQERRAPASAAAGMTEEAAANDLPAIPAFNENGTPRRLEEVEADLIRLTLARNNGRMSLTARQLGIGRSTLYRKLEAVQSGRNALMRELSGI